MEYVRLVGLAVISGVLKLSCAELVPYSTVNVSGREGM